MALTNAVIRALIVGFYVWSMWYDITKVGQKYIDKKFVDRPIFMAGRFIFLTYWNMVSVLVFSMSIQKFNGGFNQFF